MGISETVRLLLAETTEWLRALAHNETTQDRYKGMSSVKSFECNAPTAVIRDMTIWCRAGRFAVMDGSDPSRLMSPAEIFDMFVQEVRARMGIASTNIFVALFDDKNNTGLTKTQRVARPAPQGMPPEELEACKKVPENPAEYFRNLSLCVHTAEGFTAIARMIRDMAVSPRGMDMLAKAMADNQILVMDTPAPMGARSPSTVDIFFKLSGADQTLFHQRRYDLDNCIGEGDLKMVYWLHHIMTTIRDDFKLDMDKKHTILTVSADTDQVIILLLNAYIVRSRGRWMANVVHHLEHINNKKKLPEDFVDINTLHDVIMDTMRMERAWAGRREHELAMGAVTAIATVALTQQSDFCEKAYKGCGVPKVFRFAMDQVLKTGPIWSIHAEEPQFMEPRPRSDAALIHFSVASNDDTVQFVERTGMACASAERSSYKMAAIVDDIRRIPKVRHILEYWLNSCLDPGRRTLKRRRDDEDRRRVDPRETRAEERRLTRYISTDFTASVFRSLERCGK